MTSASLQVNPNARLTLHSIGRERQPVLVIDEFLADPASLINEAQAADFRPEAGFFPGHRAPAPMRYTQALEQALPTLLAKTFNTQPGDIRQVESSLSLVTQSPETLKPLQCIPHFDSRRYTDLATIYFLCNHQEESTTYGGTAFYRHRSTDYEYVDDARFSRYMQGLEEDAENLGTPGAEYIYQSTDMFEQIAAFPAVYNRILIYRCTSLHSGIIPPDFNFEQDPSKARLSINSFLVG